MDKLEKVIKGMECCLKDDCDNCPYYDPEVDHDCDYFGKCLRGNMYHDTLALLKSQKPRVMTPEEAKNAFVIEYRSGKLREAGMKILNHADPANAYYGKIYRVWTSRPNQATREATPWN